MATDKNTIKAWFRNKLKPTQEQFWAWLDSYWHKDEKIPVSVISGLNDLLSSSATVESLEALRKQVELLHQLLQSNDANLDGLQEIVNFNKQVLDALAISNIAGLQDALTELSERLSVAEKRGLQNAATIRLQANTPKVCVLPSNAMLFAIKVNGTGTVQVGRTESEPGSLGEIESTGNAVLQFGLLNVGEVWLQSDTELEIIPIIYKQ